MLSEGAGGAWKTERGTLWNKFLITPGWILMAGSGWVAPSPPHQTPALHPLPVLLFRDANEKGVAIFHGNRRVGGGLS